MHAPRPTDERTVNVYGRRYEWGVATIPLHKYMYDVFPNQIARDVGITASEPYLQQEWDLQRCCQAGADDVIVHRKGALTVT